MARDRDIVDKYSGPGTGNWKGAPKKAEKKKAAPKPKAKPAQKKAAPPKPKAKPEDVKAKGYKRKADLGGGPRKSTKKTNETQSKANSGNAVLGQGRDSAAAKKMDRQPGYGIKGTTKPAPSKPAKAPTSVRGKGAGKADTRKSGAQSRVRRNKK